MQGTFPEERVQKFALEEIFELHPLNLSIVLCDHSQHFVFGSQLLLVDAFLYIPVFHFCIYLCICLCVHVYVYTLIYLLILCSYIFICVHLILFHCSYSCSLSPCSVYGYMKQLSLVLSEEGTPIYFCIFNVTTYTSI